MRKYTVGSLFSGALDGKGVAFALAGFDILFHVEFDDWRRKVLEKHAPQLWPNAQQFKDVKTVGKTNLPYVDVLVGGFPCQDVSNAGKRAGLDEGNRSGLWFEFRRIIGELRPRVVIVENVTGLLTLGGSTVIADLAGLGYVGQWGVISAADAGAPHTRKRVFIVAYSNQIGCNIRVGNWGKRSILSDEERHATQDQSEGQGWQCGSGAVSSTMEYPHETGCEKCNLTAVTNRTRYSAGATAETMANTFGKRSGTSRAHQNAQNWTANQSGTSGKPDKPRRRPIESGFCRTVNGLSRRLDFPGFPAAPDEAQYTYEPPRTVSAKASDRRQRLEALGDGVVWQCVYPIALEIRALLDHLEKE